LHPIFANSDRMANHCCGIDFGTSNSSVAVAQQRKITLVPVEGNHLTIPSAIFFQRGHSPSYGRAAVDQFFDRHDGRFMRSLKRVLGTSLMKHGTEVNGKAMRFERIIGFFLKNLKDKTDLYCNEDVENVVIGRPVHFVDNNPHADVQAQKELEAIAQQVGFKNIEFQFEPIAAAFAHEVNISRDKLAIVVDLGGGTSDFTVIKLSRQNINKKDRSSDILANTGVRVGGNDFDKDLSLAVVMPEIGYKTTYGEKRLEVPLKPYHDLAEWSKVNFLYTTKVISQTRQIFYQSHDKTRYQRMLKVLEKEMGHTLLSSIEETKIALTQQQEYDTPFDFIEAGLHVNIKRVQFEEAIQNQIDKISNAAIECLRRAQVKNNDIQLVILTGGSTEVPAVQAEFKRLFPDAAIADENKLSSVGLGLAYDSQNKFGN
jgi:hypothetical chaperone protein